MNTPRVALILPGLLILLLTFQAGTSLAQSKSPFHSPIDLAFAPDGKHLPRGLDISPDGTLLAVAACYSDTVLLIDTATGKSQAKIAPGQEPEPSPEHRGEIIFHDATFSFQQWLS